MSTIPPKPYNVAFLLFPGADILDFSGPLEVFACTTHTPPSFPFNPTLIARTPTIAANNRGCLTVSADTTIEEARKRIADFDILVVPGGNPSIMLELTKEGGAEVEFVRAFDELPARESGKERIILSVCTGALLVAGTGALRGMKATTHHNSLDLIKEIDGSIEVMRSKDEGGVGRYVDGGRNGNGTRVVTAGGVTCGIDASLFVVELTVGREAADLTASHMEYDWKRV